MYTSSASLISAKKRHSLPRAAIEIEAVEVVKPSEARVAAKPSLSLHVAHTVMQVNFEILDSQAASTSCFHARRRRCSRDQLEPCANASLRVQLEQRPKGRVIYLTSSDSYLQLNIVAHPCTMGKVTWYAKQHEIATMANCNLVIEGNGSISANAALLSFTG